MNIYGNQDYSNWMQPFQNQYPQQYYAPQAAQANPIGNTTSVTLSWIVSAVAPPKLSLVDKVRNRIYGPPEGDTGGYKTILNNVTGVVRPGQLCAIMGASGAGKTTLLNILNFRNKSKMDISGDIRVNGKPVTLEEISEYSGYVQQNDVFIGTMTVREWLVFQAQLKMGRNNTDDEKYYRVDQVISQVNLFKAQDNFIGMGDKMKGISGGEKRRLAFATEILTNPPLLFADEPTSGLDAYMAVGLVEIMAEQVKQGKTIICTIHQPSTQIFEKFDTLCLLSEGRIAYLGPRTEALGFFAGLGFQCPRNYNPADYYISVLAILPNSREQSLLKSAAICDAFQQSQYQSSILSTVGMLHSSYDPSYDVKFKRGYNASLAQQFRWLLWRNFISDMRTPISTKILVIQTLFIGIFFGLIYLQLDLDETGVGNTNGLLFILMMNVGFIFLFPILNVFANEMPVFYRDHKNKLYSTLVYYLSKQIAEFPKYFILSFILATICYWMANVRNNGSVFIQIVLTFVLSSQVSLSFGYFLSVVSSNVEFATAIAAPILIPLILFAGFFLSNSTTPVYFIWIKYISWFYYTYDAIMIELWTSYDSIPCSNPIVNGCPNARCFKDGAAVLASFEIYESNLARNIILLFVIAIVLRVLGYFILRVRVAFA